MAAGMTVTIPTLLFFKTAQRYLVSDQGVSAVKE
jgi:ABC-type glycerol-3-phosphate transport system permease component